MIICETLVIHEEEVAMVSITCSHGIFRFRIIQCSTILGHQKFLFSPEVKPLSPQACQGVVPSLAKY